MNWPGVTLERNVLPSDSGKGHRTARIEVSSSAHLVVKPWKLSIAIELDPAVIL
jgi:hypothetical protein